MHWRVELKSAESARCAPVLGWRPEPNRNPRSSAAARNPSGNSHGLSMASKSSRIRNCHCMAAEWSPERNRSYMRRVTSGTTLLEACVPPSQPIISMGTRTASQPVRNVKSGRCGRTAEIIRIMKARSPEESLMPITLGNSQAKRRIVGTSIGLANIGIL